MEMMRLSTLAPVLFCALPSWGVLLLILAQRMGGNPFGLLLGKPRFPSLEQQLIHWQSVIEVVLVPFMLLPVMIILYVLLLAFAGVTWMVNLLMVLGCLLFFLLALENMDTCTRYRASERWPTTWGRVYSRARGEQFPNAAPNLQNQDTVYVYAVNGTQYVGYRIDAHNYYRNPLVRRPLPRPRDAEQVLVYYHPYDPETALLVPGINWSSVGVFMGCSLTFLMVPLFFAAF